MDKTAVAVNRINFYSEEVVVGHLLKNMSKIVFMFLSLLYCAYPCPTVPIPAQLGNVSVVEVNTDWKSQLIFIL